MRSSSPTSSSGCSTSSPTCRARSTSSPTIRARSRVPAGRSARAGRSPQSRSMFLHGSWAHLLGNMLFLWIFGNNVEDALGKAPLPRPLPRRRPCSDCAPDLHHAQLRERARRHDSERRCQRRDLGRPRRLPGAAPPREGADADRLRPPRAPRRLLPARLVRLPAPGRERLARAAGAGRRRRVLRPHRRLRVRLRSPSSRSNNGSRSHPPTDDVRGARHAPRSTRSRRTSPRRSTTSRSWSRRQNREEPDLYGLFDWPEYMPAKISIYRQAARRGFRGSGRARGADPRHRPARAGALLRHGRGPDRRPRLRLKRVNVAFRLRRGAAGLKRLRHRFKRHENDS